MKNLCLILLLAMFNLSYSFGQEDNYSPASECSNFNAFNRGENIQQVLPLIYMAYPNGSLLIDPEKMENGTSIEDIFTVMEVDQGTTFEFEMETQSRFNSEKVYRKYQQYHNGVKVEGGGYTSAYFIPSGPGGEPCDELAMISPYILNEIDAPTNPSISASDVPNILNAGPIQNAELVISHNLNNLCEYSLAWRASYYLESSKISWIDAISGDILKTVDVTMNLNAPMVTYPSPQWLNDRPDGGTTFLESPDSRIRTYDFGVNCPNTTLNQNQWSNNLVPSTTNNVWTNEAAPDVYQSFFVTSSVAAVFDMFEIDFGNINVGSCAIPNAFSLNGSTTQDAFILIGDINGTPLALFDVIAHELAHTFLNDFLDYTAAGNSSLHEGISDMIGTLIESIIQGNVDWIMGDDEPIVANAIGRDLANPTNNCFTNVQNFPFPGQRHDRSEPLSHWFFLAAAGNATIPGIGLEDALAIVLESLQSIGRNSDYPDLMAATLMVAEDEFGRCSDQFLSVARAWEAICVTTNIPLQNGLVPDCNHTFEGPLSVCEESDNFTVCLNGGPNNSYYNWTVIGKKSTSYVMNGNQSGNSTQSGSCVTIFDIPKYPYYPQYITIDLLHSSAGISLRRRIVIKDCNGDDPTCKEYYGLKPISNNQEVGNQLSNDLPVYVKIYDLMGKLQYEGTIEQYNKENFRGNGIYVFAYFDKFGKVTEVKKSLLLEQ